MLQTIWHHFSAQFSLLFQMLHSILLAVLPLKTITTDWCKTFNSQSGSIKIMVLKCNTESKTEYTIWKSNEKWTEKWCQIVCSILFDLFHCMTSSDWANSFQLASGEYNNLGSMFLQLSASWFKRIQCILKCEFNFC